ncbi:MAG: hypothetical protein GY710_27130 [Desulfobacteraceae bacterium]|nr:hypothetical protein [Desulfobacteraceae bacterium]
MLTNKTWQLDKSENGISKIDGNVLYLFSSDTKKSINMRHPVQSRDRLVLLSGDIRNRNIIAGKKPWNKARLILIQYEGQTIRYNLPHIAASMEGSHDWKHYQKAFKIMPWTTKFQVVAQLSHCTGSMQIKNIRLYPVVLSQVYMGTQKIIIGSWGIFFVFLLGSCLVKGKYGVQAILIISFTAILFGTMIPGDLKIKLYGWLIDKVWIVDTLSNLEKKIIIGQIGHFCFFSVLGLALGGLMPEISMTHIGINILILAWGTELVQFFIDGRTPMLVDFLIDLSGGIAGLITVKLLCKNRRDLLKSDQ